MPRFLATSLMVALFSAMPRALYSQEEDNIPFTWHSENGCASRSEVVSKVTDILGDDSFKTTKRQFLGTVRQQNVVLPDPMMLVRTVRHRKCVALPFFGLCAKYTANMLFQRH